jgi:hypothetical protein
VRDGGRGRYLALEKHVSRAGVPAMDWCRRQKVNLLELLAVEQAALSKCLDVERDARDLTCMRSGRRYFGSC